MNIQLLMSLARNTNDRSLIMASRSELRYSSTRLMAGTDVPDENTSRSCQSVSPTYSHHIRMPQLPEEFEFTHCRNVDAITRAGCGNF